MFFYGAKRRHRREAPPQARSAAAGAKRRRKREAPPQARSAAAGAKRRRRREAPPQARSAAANVFFVSSFDLLSFACFLFLFLSSSLSLCVV